MNMEFPTIDVKATGARIRKLRMERGLTIREVSEYMGFTTDQAVCKWQRGDSLPTVDNLYALSKLFGTTMEDILVGTTRCPLVFCYGNQGNVSGLLEGSNDYTIGLVVM